jgi:DNA-binding CsgD family transcriptional regulator
MNVSAGLSAPSVPFPGPERPGRMVEIPASYEECDLSVESLSAERRVPSSRLHAELVKEPCPKRRSAIVRHALQGTGFEWLTCVTMTMRPNGPVPVAYLATYAHRDWATRYFENAMWATDRRHALAARSTIPLMWSLGSLAEPLRADIEGDLRAMDVLEAMAAHDVRSGLFFSLPTPDPHEYGVVSLVARGNSCDWMDDDVLGKAMVLATSLHELVSRATRAGDTTSVMALSSTQRRVLERLCDGHGDKRIAAELGMTTHNVDYHLRALRRRFGARNRVQLAQMATVHFMDSALAGLDGGLEG